MSFFCRVPWSVVKMEAKYAVGDFSVFCSCNVASRAFRRVAGVFWCARDEEV
jgi:hypothetical protein